MSSNFITETKAPGGKAPNFSPKQKILPVPRTKENLKRMGFEGEYLPADRVWQRLNDSCAAPVELWDVSLLLFLYLLLHVSSFCEACGHFYRSLEHLEREKSKSIMFYTVLLFATAAAAALLWENNSLNVDNQ